MKDLTTILLPLMPHLTKTIIKAGSKIMDIYESDFDVFTKGDASPVTEADRLGEEIITRALTKLTPDIPVIGEEAKDAGKAPDITGGRFWLVDPLDGTKEFVKKGNDFTVNIGLIENGIAKFGLVFAPARKRLWAGFINHFAWVSDVNHDTISGEKPIKTRKINKSHIIIVASKSHRSPELEAWLEHFPGAEHISVGSSLKLCLVAEGKADLYPRLGPTCEWDTAAAHAVLSAAGGIVNTADSNPLLYGKDLKTFLNPHFICISDPSFDVPTID